MTVTATPPAPGPGQPASWRRSHTFYDEQGQRQRSRIPVPVNEYGELAEKGFRCRRCVEPYWYRSSIKGIPVCAVHELKMTPLQMRRPALLPYRELWDVVERPLRPVWTLPGMAGLGVAVDAAPIPALAVVGAVPLVFEVTRRSWRRYRIGWHTEQGNLDRDDPQHGKRLRTAIDAAARKVGYTAAGASAWLAAAAGLGLDPSTTAGRLAWSLLLPVWGLPAATWWRMLRLRAARRTAVAQPEPEAPAGPGPDPEEARVRRIWQTVLAVRGGDVIGVASDGVTPVKATQAGKLPGTELEDWQRITGGWSAVIVGPIGAFESETFAKSVGKVASAYSVKKSMVTVMPDADDENRALLMVQRQSPIADTVRWAGPASIDPVAGVAPMARYADDAFAMYELYRPGWGSPHDFLSGTTGAGKSEALSTLLLIDRWASHVDEHGQRRGMVADLLIDPQQGQSYGPFLDDLAAPVATSIEEAMLVAEAFKREMLRRNKYLANVRWEDEKRRRRKGRKWWNPLVDGPILTLNIDEAHEFLAFRTFAALITSGSRMYRKCGMRIRIATHTPLLSDLGGSMALRSMLTGGFVWVGRTADSLSGPTAFNGRLPVDPRSIPAIPGSCFVLSGTQSKPMLARTMWEPDYYDWVRDEQDQPIGYPAALPPETLDAFGKDFTRWAESVRRGDDVPWTPGQETGAAVGEPTRVVAPVNAVLAALWTLNPGPVDMDLLTRSLRDSGVEASILELRNALAELRGDGMVETHDGRHRLTEQGRTAVAELAAA